MMYISAYPEIIVMRNSNVSNGLSRPHVDAIMSMSLPMALWLGASNAGTKLMLTIRLHRYTRNAH